MKQLYLEIGFEEHLLTFWKEMVSSATSKMASVKVGTVLPNS